MYLLPRSFSFAVIATLIATIFLNHACKWRYAQFLTMQRAFSLTQKIILALLSLLDLLGRGGLL